MTETTDGVETRLESRLASVVVHAAGAVCVRRAAGKPGGRRLVVEGLPDTLAEHSLRARIRSGPPGMRVTDVRLELAAAVQDPGQRALIERELKDAVARGDALRERCARLAQEVERTERLRAASVANRRAPAPVESLLALASFVDRRMRQLYERLGPAEEELRRADHETGVLRDRLARLSTAEPTGPVRTTAAAVITLDGAVREAEFEVEYLVPGAAWLPVYQLRLDGERSTLVLRACVAQRTGEDWTGVRLGLSTADLQRRTDLPELRSLRIGRRQAEPVPGGWREPPAGLAELFTPYDAAVAARPEPASAPVAVAGPAGFAGGAAEVMDDLDVSYASGDARQGAESAPPLPPPAFAGPVAAPSGPPPPAPGAAPMPQSAAPRPAPRSARGAARFRSRSAPDAYGAPPWDGAQAAPAAQPPAPAPTADLLDYARLELAGPEDPTARGTLRPRRTPVTYRETTPVARRPQHTVDVRQSAGSFDYRFDTAAPVDVAADGVWHTVPVCVIPVEARQEYVTVPAADESVYGTVLLTNTSGHALLAGPADVTVNGDYVLTTPLPTLAPGERRRIGVGVAESVQVARRTRMTESSAGLRGGTTVLDHGVEIELANRLAHPVLVEVRERVPVSTDKDVRVEDHRADPAWFAPDEPLDDGQGLVRGARVWRVEVAPGRTTVLRGGYEIRIPSDKAVHGGNRRD
ncbi:hypothetical protein SRB5_46020 [Streptomyces sp. RB5]|uniref:DUF4139 domain-containing protein n=1 Tax=Streptomyces smaragdinus TaxID=2585196 RepID=A0A7K0CLS4_9ACTN|nr:DUF4139 domain-containing protein [Streptomyces smaragdinus]MQY14435.1 hypothetical protein [Streptomyces smaragdinus]